MIVHFARRQEWEDAKAGEDAKYTPAAYEEDGFIHGCTPKQAPAVADTHFAGEDGIVLLWISPGKIKAGIVYERPPGQEIGELYPHIYGPLNVDAVVGEVELEPFEAGGFVLPKQPSE